LVNLSLDELKLRLSGPAFLALNWVTSEHAIVENAGGSELKRVQLRAYDVMALTTP